MLDAKALEAAARKLRNAEKEKFGSWSDANDSKSIAAAAITAYLQAVGPEPAVAVKPLEWGDDRYVKTFGMVWSVHRAFGMWYWHGPDGADDQAFETIEAAKAAAEADYASRIRSALVATPPAETVVEAANETTVRLWDFANGDYRYPAYRGRAPEGTPTLRGDIKATLDMLAILATKSAVKDDETVVEALEIARGCILRSNNHWKDDDLAKINAALAAKDGLLPAAPQQGGE